MQSEDLSHRARTNLVDQDSASAQSGGATAAPLLWILRLLAGAGFTCLLAGAVAFSSKLFTKTYDAPSSAQLILLLSGTALLIISPLAWLVFTRLPFSLISFFYFMLAVSICLGLCITGKEPFIGTLGLLMLGFFVLIKTMRAELARVIRARRQTEAALQAELARRERRSETPP